MLKRVEIHTAGAATFFFLFSWGVEILIFCMVACIIICLHHCFIWIWNEKDGAADEEALRKEENRARQQQQKTFPHFSYAAVTSNICFKADRKRMSNDGLKQTFLDSSLRWDAIPRFTFTPVLLSTFGWIWLTVFTSIIQFFLAKWVPQIILNCRFKWNWMKSIAINYSGIDTVKVTISVSMIRSWPC